MNKIIENSVILKTAIFNIRSLKVKSPIDENFTRVIVESSNVVHILPYNPTTKKVFLIEEFRFGANQNILAFPAGHIDNMEHSEVSARRELREEIGMDGKLIPLTFGFSSPGFLSEKSFLYLAIIDKELTEEEKKDFPLDENEIIKIKPVSIEELKILSENGEIKCLKSQFLIALFLNWLSQNT